MSKNVHSQKFSAKNVQKPSIQTISKPCQIQAIMLLNHQKLVQSYRLYRPGTSLWLVPSKPSSLIKNSAPTYPIRFNRDMVLQWPCRKPHPSWPANRNTGWWHHISSSMCAEYKLGWLAPGYHFQFCSLLCGWPACSLSLLISWLILWLLTLCLPLTTHPNLHQQSTDSCGWIGTRSLTILEDFWVKAKSFQLMRTVSRLQWNGWTLVISTSVVLMACTL